MLIVGCGYVGSRLAQRLTQDGNTVFVTTRSSTRAAAYRESGWNPLILDVTDVDTLAELPRVSTVVFAVGFDRKSNHSIDEVYVQGMRNFLSKCPSTLERLIYISSTGVYGDSDGKWIDENSPCLPNRPGGKACLAAETALREHPVFGERSIILRLAGIYGPNRLPQLTRLREGKSIEVAADSYLNLIHVDDAVGIIDAVSRQTEPPALLCVCDGESVLRRDFYHQLAVTMNLEQPKFEPPPTGSSQASRARGNKRIRNTRLKNTLEYQFKYPSFREGLSAIVAIEEQS